MSGAKSLFFDFKSRAIPIRISIQSEPVLVKNKLGYAKFQSAAQGFRLFAFAMLFVLKFLSCEVTVKKCRLNH